MNTEVKQITPVQVRWMIRVDMPTVMDIERTSFEFAWAEDEFVSRLRQRNCIGMVAEHKDRVLGYMVYELHRDSLYIVNFAVHPKHRREGIGQQMIQKLLGKLSPQRRKKMMLETRETNLTAQLFFKALGFRAVGIVRDFYADTSEDAYQMVYRVENPGEDRCPK